MAGFDVTFKMGDDFEDFTILDLREKGFPNAYKNIIKDNFCFYDIILPDIEKTLECKFDAKGLESGNICVETGCNGRLSGILDTKAEYWLFSDSVTSYLIEYTQIRKCINENPNLDYRRNHAVDQEDGSTKDMNFYLIPKRIFIPYCCEVAGINEMKYNKLI